MLHRSAISVNKLLQLRSKVLKQCSEMECLKQLEKESYILLALKRTKKERKKENRWQRGFRSVGWVDENTWNLHASWKLFISSNEFKRVRLIEAKSEKRCRYEMSGTELSIFVRRKTNPLRNAMIISIVTI